jgi:uncharacterized protein (DUF2235 family)
VPKNIILCSDGTGNSIGKGRGTNVARIHEALDLYGHRDDEALRPQLALHDDGVGTQDHRVLRLLGGAFGWGLSRNVRELYTALCRWYEPGDAIYLFGFSRGAFTVRTLAGLIADCGIVDRRHWQTDADLRRLVREAYSKHRMKYESKAFRWFRRVVGLRSAEKASQQFRLTKGLQHWKLAPGGEVPIRFVGVWDTVDALGFPIDHLADLWNTFVYRFKFPDCRLSENVKKACHAVAIDDERHTFHPVMWDERREGNGRIEQVWFAGAHSNVGGGYPKEGMSLVALHWMMTKARAEGLRFSPRALEDHASRQNVNDQLYDSRSGVAVYYRYKPRDIGKICEGNGIRPKVHASVFERIACATDGYAPGNLPGAVQIVDTNAAHGADAKLEALVNEALSNARGELARARKWVLLRRNLHYLLVAATAALLLVKRWSDVEASPASGLARSAADWATTLEPSIGPWLGHNVVLPVLSNPLLAFGLLATALGFQLLSRLARARIASIYSTFWRRTLSGSNAPSQEGRSIRRAARGRTAFAPTAAVPAGAPGNSPWNRGGIA